MHETESKAKGLCELKEALLCQVKPHIHAGVFEPNVDGCAVGQTIDMIKDLCDAEKNLWKACYYKTVTKAMKETEEEDEPRVIFGYPGMSRSHARYGYNNRRYNSGQYAPKGAGHYSGYMPDDRFPDFMDPVMENTERMQEGMGLLGYPEDRRMTTKEPDKGRYGYPMNRRYGMPYNEYEDAKKYYTDTKDGMAKKEMMDHIDHHLEDVIDTTKEMWMDAKPETKKAFKEEMMKLLKDI